MPNDHHRNTTKPLPFIFLYKGRQRTGTIHKPWEPMSRVPKKTKTTDVHYNYFLFHWHCKEKYSSQLANITTTYLYKHTFLMFYNFYITFSKNKSLEGKATWNRFWLGWNAIQQFSQGLWEGEDLKNRTNRLKVTALKEWEVNQIQVNYHS